MKVMLEILIKTMMEKGGNDDGKYDGNNANKKDGNNHGNKEIKIGNKDGNTDRI